MDEGAELKHDVIRSLVNVQSKTPYCLISPASGRQQSHSFPLVLGQRRGDFVSCPYACVDKVTIGSRRVGGGARPGGRPSSSGWSDGCCAARLPWATAIAAGRQQGSLHRYGSHPWLKQMYRSSWCSSLRPLPSSRFQRHRLRPGACTADCQSAVVVVAAAAVVVVAVASGAGGFVAGRRAHA